MVRTPSHAIQGLHGHDAMVIKAGSSPVASPSVPSIDSPRREGIRKSHTGTHVLHWAIGTSLETMPARLGPWSRRPAALRLLAFLRGRSRGASRRGRGDQPSSRRQRPVSTTVTSKEEAQEMGALAFFGDKYGETVRVVQVGDFSTEFCGGTHTSISGQVGPLLIVSESRSAPICAVSRLVTGMAAYDHLVSTCVTRLERPGDLLRTTPDQVPSPCRTTAGEGAGLEEELQKISGQRLGARRRVSWQPPPTRVGRCRGGRRRRGDMTATSCVRSPSGLRDRLGAPSLGDRSSSEWQGLARRGAHQGSGRQGPVSAASSSPGPLGSSAEAVLRDPELAQAGGPDGNLLETALNKPAKTSGGRWPLCEAGPRCRLRHETGGPRHLGRARTHRPPARGRERAAATSTHHCAGSLRSTSSARSWSVCPPV